MKRRLATWTHFLGATREVHTIDFPMLDRFVRERREGSIQPPGHELPKSPSNRTVAADLEFLRAALNHATRVVRPTGARLLLANPVAGYEPPRSASPRRPAVTYDRFLKVLAHADAVLSAAALWRLHGARRRVGLARWPRSARCAPHTSISLRPRRARTAGSSRIPRPTRKAPAVGFR